MNMNKYVLIGLIAAALLVVCGLCYFAYNKYKTAKCNGESCVPKKDNTSNCVGDVCTRPEIEKVEPVDNISTLSDDSSTDSA